MKVIVCTSHNFGLSMEQTVSIRQCFRKKCNMTSYWTQSQCSTEVADNGRGEGSTTSPQLFQICKVGQKCNRVGSQEAIIHYVYTSILA